MRIANVVNVKGAFLYGEFDDGEKIYIKIPIGFEEFYKKDEVLLLKKCLYGLKQAAMAFYRKLRAAASNIGLTRPKLSRPMSILQVGRRKSGHHDLMD